MKHSIFITTILLFIVGSAQMVNAQTRPSVVPLPNEYYQGQGKYIFPKQNTFSIKGCEDVEAISDLKAYLQISPLQAIEAKKASIRININPDFGASEAYSLSIKKNRIEINATTTTGAFYAIQTLLQLTDNANKKEIDCLVINDAPRFPYRGIHVDVSRHFRSVEFMKKQMDAMALFKLNKMHIHLTDAAGWRLQIDAYPRLTSFAAWRTETKWEDWWSGNRLYAEEGTPSIYGGYYTKDDIREFLAYARLRHIDVIPEIEMPGHSEEVLAAYPELGCSNQAYMDSEFCVGSEKTFEFLENVLTEVIELFPSKYIHIGGDEARKQHWKTCPACQKRMKDEGLKDVDELQSYLIKRVEKFINSKGRSIIGWDEILQGGLAPNATVMSWRGIQGGIEAMNKGHDVIMTPGKHCYLDNAQDAPFKEPRSIGGYVPLDTVYVYNPMPKEAKEDKKHHLLGIQGNLWSEYITKDEHCEYMYYPRALAIAEIGWTQPDKKNLKDFRERVIPALALLRDMGYTTFDLENEYGNRKIAQKSLQHKAVGAKVIYNIPWSKKYPAAGETTFTDGIIGGWTYKDQRWQGYLTPIDVTIDLGEKMQVNYIGGTFMQLVGPDVIMPEYVIISVSNDGENFREITKVWNDVSTSVKDLLFKDFSTICNEQVRYIRYQAARSTKGGWLFLDEIVIN